MGLEARFSILRKGGNLRGTVKTNLGDLTVVSMEIEMNTQRMKVGKDVVDFSILRQTMRGSLYQEYASFLAGLA